MNLWSFFQNKIRSSITAKILLSTIAVIMLVYISFTILTYYRTHSVLDKTVEDNLKITAAKVIEQMDTYFYAKSMLVQAVAYNNKIIDEIKSHKSIESAQEESTYKDLLSDTLYSILLTDGDISNAFITVLEGDYYINYSGNVYKNPYSVEETIWYQEYMNINSSVHISSPYKDFNGKDAVMLYAPLYDSQDNKLLAFISIELLVSDMPRILQNASVPLSTVSLLIAPNGIVIYSPYSKAVMKNYRETGVVETDDFMSTISEESQMYDSTMEYENMYMRYYKNPYNYWSSVSKIDKTLINREYFTLNFIFIFNIVAISIVTLISVYITVQKTLKTIPQILSTIDKIGDGIYTQKIRSTSADEIGQIANSIDNLCDEMQQKLDTIESYSRFDTLTGLPNRNNLINILNQQVEIMQRNNQKLAVACIDLDDFKYINDTLGHSFGDEILIRFADLLVSHKRSSDFVSRFGGDEFVMIFPNISDKNVITEFFYEVKRHLEKRITIFDKEIYVRFTGGVTFFPEDALSADNLIKYSDMAMYRAKEFSKNKVEYYNSSIENDINFRSKISQYLNDAIANNELYLNFQPIVNTKDRKVHGFETLLRWKSKELGFISPAEFIPIAEDTGLINPIGSWIFREACIIHQEFCKIYGSDIIISINISPEQMRQESFLDDIKTIIRETKIDPNLLQIEITESTLINFTEVAVNILNEISSLGIKIALDDFGTGYSSLSYLKSFPINCLKIDKSFIDEITNNKKDFAITSSIISLVHNIDMKTVAEGVEVADQFKNLIDMDCDYIQGYYTSRPLSKEDAIKFLEVNKGDKRTTWLE